MANSNLLKEAIADAKAVRETALANAKIALEEAFTPRIQSMLSAKLAEEEEMEEAAEEPVETNGSGMDTAAGADVNEEEDMEEGMHGDEEKNEGMHGDDEVSETEEVEEGEHGDMEEDLELEAIIKELEEELDDSGIGDGDNKVDVADDHTEDPGEGELTAEGEEDKVEEGEKDDMDEDISLDEIISALKEEEDMDETKDEMDEGEKDKVDETEKELEEAYNVIKFMKSKLNEVNLLNAKLLFSNKLFRNHSLNENQKMKVIENFDRASNLREVKLVYATLSEGFSLNNVSKTKRTIKESYASKSSRSTAPSKKVISEGSDLSARWKKLANL
jgi:hypothetical protein